MVRIIFYVVKMRRHKLKSSSINLNFPIGITTAWKGQIKVICLDKFGIGSNDLGNYSDKYSVCLDKLPIRVRTNMGICTDEQAFCLDK